MNKFLIALMFETSADITKYLHLRRYTRHILLAGFVADSGDSYFVKEYRTHTLVYFKRHKSIFCVRYDQNDALEQVMDMNNEQVQAL